MSLHHVGHESAPEFSRKLSYATDASSCWNWSPGAQSPIPNTVELGALPELMSVQFGSEGLRTYAYSVPAVRTRRNVPVVSVVLIEPPFGLIHDAYCWLYGGSHGPDVRATPPSAKNADELRVDAAEVGPDEQGVVDLVVEVAVERALRPDVLIDLVVLAAGDCRPAD